MRIAGAGHLKRRTEDVFVGHDEDGREVYVKILAPRAGLLEDIAVELPIPEVPKTGKVMRNDRNQIIKNPDGTPAQEQNLSDPKFLSELKVVNGLRTIASIYHCVDPTQVQFSTPRDPKKSHRDFYEAVRLEMHEAGFDFAVINALEQAVDRLSIITKEEVDAAADVLGEKDASGKSSGPWPGGVSELVRSST